jgi:iron(III) transport system ATP-binding protein
VILLDEPFSGLDAPLRAELRLEVRRVLAETGATGIFVTHDQEEAFVVGDEIAVMREGRILQQGDAATLYELPATREVAEFIGDANLVDGIGDGDVAHTPLGVVPLHAPARGPVRVMIRPERLLAEPGGGATVEEVEYFGHDAVYRVRLADGGLVRSRVIGAPALVAGDPVTLAFTGAPTVAYPV